MHTDTDYTPKYAYRNTWKHTYRETHTHTHSHRYPKAPSSNLHNPEALVSSHLTACPGSAAHMRPQMGDPGSQDEGRAF